MYGIEPICRALPIAPSTYHEQVTRRRETKRLPARAKRDAELEREIRRMSDDNFKVYGVRIPSGPVVWLAGQVTI